MSRYTMSTCQFHESMCLPLQYYESILIPWVKKFKLKRKKKLTKIKCSEIPKYRSTEIEVTDVTKYKLNIYKNASDINTDIQNTIYQKKIIQFTEIQIFKWQKYKSQKCRNTNYSNTEINLHISKKVILFSKFNHT